MPEQQYSGDLTDAQWAVVATLIPPPGQGGRKREVDMRQVVNAIRYLLATGCGWRGLPDRFPHHSTVRHYYDVWRKTGVWARLEPLLTAQRDSQPPSLRPGDERAAGE
jgi:putative transposase